MSIEVRSNEPVTQAPKAEAQSVPHQDSSDQTASAPGASASEQNESSESDPVETEAHEGDEAEPEESESNSETKDDAKPGKKKGGFQRRIDKLNQRISAREQELEYWKQQAIKGAGDSKPESKVETKQTAAADGKPKPEEFDSHIEYVEALTDWKTDQKLKERDQKLERSKIETEHEKQVKSYVERMNSFAEKVEDFQDVIEAVDNIPLSPSVRDILLSSENGPELAYELAKNREEYARVCKLPPLAAAREMGKLEAKVAAKASSGNQTETKKVTKAPKPIEPVGAGGKSSAPKSIFDPSLSQADYERLRREQIKRRQA